MQDGPYPINKYLDVIINLRLSLKVNVENISIKFLTSGAFVRRIPATYVFRGFHTNSLVIF